MLKRILFTIAAFSATLTLIWVLFGLLEGTMKPWEFSDVMKFFFALGFIVSVIVGAATCFFNYVLSCDLPASDSPYEMN